METFSCAMAAQRAAEDLIGTAGHYQTYVLIECPTPWAAEAFDSKSIPAALRQYAKEIKVTRSIQFLCINRGISAPSAQATVPQTAEPQTAEPQTAEPQTAVLIYEQFENGYRGYEFQLDSLDQVVACLEAYWQGQRIGQIISQKDILVCTHGMRDKCCARFGQPFFRAAKQAAKQGQLPNSRIWKVSHIGGHRFAPTAISLPDGRYYGRLTISALQAIVTRSGSVSQLCSFYRGWGLLPPPLQILERHLLLSYGWSWLDHKITYRILTSEASNSQIEAEIYVEPGFQKGMQQSDGTAFQRNRTLSTYYARLVQNTAQTCSVKLSCSSASPSTIVKYLVAECSLVSTSSIECLKLQRQSLFLDSFCF
jgi:hypothetical protein